MIWLRQTNVINVVISFWSERLNWMGQVDNLTALVYEALQLDATEPGTVCCENPVLSKFDHSPVAQVPNRGGLPMGNGLTNQGMGRGNLAASGKQGQRMQGPGIPGLGALNPNLQRSNAQGIAGLNNLNQRNLQNLTLGGKLLLRDFKCHSYLSCW